MVRCLLTNVQLSGQHEESFEVSCWIVCRSHIVQNSGQSRKETGWIFTLQTKVAFNQKSDDFEDDFDDKNVRCFKCDAWYTTSRTK